jgi:hypothetical protein
LPTIARSQLGKALAAASASGAASKSPLQANRSGRVSDSTLWTRSCFARGAPKTPA